MSDNEASITRLLDEAAIRDATARFADILMRADYDAFRTLWADDAEWVIGGTEGQPFERRAQGVDDIVALFRDLWKGNDSFVHFAVQGVIEVNGDDTTAQCVCHEQARGPEDRYYRTHGIWSDRLRRSDDGWVFTSRSYHYLWLDMAPFLETPSASFLRVRDRIGSRSALYSAALTFTIDTERRLGQRRTETLHVPK